MRISREKYDTFIFVNFLAFMSFGRKDRYFDKKWPKIERTADSKLLLQ